MLAAAGGIDGARVLDLFAGSGALGIEALSRGAAEATFVERDDVARAVLVANLEELGLRRGRGRRPTAEDTTGEGADRPVRVRGGDALAALESAGAESEHFDLVFVDPPYAEVAALWPALGGALLGVLESGATVVCESDRRSPFELDLVLERERRYGDTLIRIYRRGDRSR